MVPAGRQYRRHVTILWSSLALCGLFAAGAAEHRSGWGYAPDGWTASCELADAPASATDSLPLAFDREAGTRWTTGRPMQKGDTFILDLGRVVPVREILLDPGASRRDFARGLTLDLDPGDGQWVRLDQAEQLLGDDGTCRLTFAPRDARRLRFTNHGTATGLWWSIHELYVWGPSPPGSPDARAGRLIPTPFE